jgi:hypothetical protein
MRSLPITGSFNVEDQIIDKTPEASNIMKSVLELRLKTCDIAVLSMKDEKMIVTSLSYCDLGDADLGFAKNVVNHLKAQSDRSSDPIEVVRIQAREFKTSFQLVKSHEIFDEILEILKKRYGKPARSLLFSNVL